jgi:hypothetical protein
MKSKALKIDKNSQEIRMVKMNSKESGQRKKT